MSDDTSFALDATTIAPPHPDCEHGWTGTASPDYRYCILCAGLERRRAMTTAEKIDKFAATFNEVAIGYNDSGGFWHFQYGPRGSGSMLDGIGYRFAAHDAESLDEALDALLVHLQI